MSERINSIVDKMLALETELQNELKTTEKHLHHRFAERIEGIKNTANSLQERLSGKAAGPSRIPSWRHVLSVPFIYAMIFPLALLDLFLFFYQLVCFRLYRISSVKRADHFIIDRQMLDNLTGIDKFNCVYCGYGNGVISYAREIISRTEQYWCPIKHAQKIAGASARYEEFLEYGDTENYHEKLNAYREKLGDSK